MPIDLNPNLHHGRKRAKEENLIDNLDSQKLLVAPVTAPKFCALTIIHEAKGDGMGMAVDVVVEPRKKGKVFSAAERFMILTSTLSHSHPTERNSVFPVTAESLLSFRITFGLQLADSLEWTSPCGRLCKPKPKS